MPKTIISDTSCFILLDKIDELALLNKVYGEITTTPEIATEFGFELPSWVSIRPALDKGKQALLALHVDYGEASALALALETEDSILVLDDNKARKMADRLRMKYTGTLGVIIRAKLAGYIPSIRPILGKIKKTNFRISPELESLALKEAEER